MRKERVRRFLEIAVYAVLSTVRMPHSLERRREGACFGALFMLPTEVYNGLNNQEIEDMIDDVLRCRDQLSVERLRVETSYAIRVLARATRWSDYRNEVDFALQG